MEVSQKQVVSILSDSYLNCYRVKGSIKNNYLELSPHATKTARIINFASGGQTFRRLTENIDELEQWVQCEPTITIIHIGACDLINKNTNLDIQDINVGQKFINLVTDFISDLNNLAEKYWGNKFHVWANKHKYIFVQLPDWGQFESHRTNSLNWKEYRTLRKKINKNLKDYMSRFWHHHKVLVIQPRTANEPIEGVHLSPNSQAIYNRDIFNAVARLLCVHCFPKGEFSNKTLQEEKMCTQRQCKKEI